MPYQHLSDVSASRDELEALVRSLPYGDFRRHRSVGIVAARRVLLGTLNAELVLAAGSWVCHVDEQLAGCAILSPLTWDSEFFGHEMGAVRLLVGRQHRRRTARQLLCQVLESADRFEHLAVRLDADDFDLRAVAEELGFRVMDTVCTYEHFPCDAGFPAVLEQRFHVRPYQPEDRAAVLAVAHRCFRNYPNRVFIDPRLGPAAAARLYEAWTERCCSGVMAQRILVAEHRGSVVGFLGWRVHPDLAEHAGVRLHGAGLGGCLPTRLTAYRELLWHAVRSLDGEPADFDTHLFNVATIQAYQQLGFRFVGARHTLHRWS